MTKRKVFQESPPIFVSDKIYKMGRISAPCDDPNISDVKRILPSGKHTKNIKKLWKITIFDETIHLFY